MGHCHTATPMRRMRITTASRILRTSQRHSTHPIYPYPFRQLTTAGALFRATQSGTLLMWHLQQKSPIAKF